MLVHIVYAHPDHAGFVGALLDAFVGGLTDAGHTHTMSDLYQMGFNPVMSPAEYARESRFDPSAPVAADVAAEHAKLDAADAWAFVYPVWWTDCPAIMKGWFDRVWTVGWAYGPAPLQPDSNGQLVHQSGSRRSTKKAVVLCSAGHLASQLREWGCYQAMETMMLTDRIFDRADEKEFHVFDGSAVVFGEEWAALRAQHLADARALGRHM